MPSSINIYSVAYSGTGVAQIGDMSLCNATNKAPIYGKFSKLHPSIHHVDLTKAHIMTVTYSDSNPAIWIAHVNTTQNSRAAFTASRATALLSLSEGTGSAKPVRFTIADTATRAQPGQITDAWTLYGKYVLLSRPNANFYAERTGTDGCYSLLWSDTMASSVDYISIILRITGPSTGTI